MDRKYRLACREYQAVARSYRFHPPMPPDGCRRGFGASRDSRDSERFSQSTFKVKVWSHISLAVKSLCFAWMCYQRDSGFRGDGQPQPYPSLTLAFTAHSKNDVAPPAYRESDGSLHAQAIFLITSRRSKITRKSVSWRIAVVCSSLLS